MMICSKCGSQLEPGSIFCPECGTQVPDGVQDNVNASQSPYQDPAMFQGSLKSQTPLNLQKNTDQQLASGAQQSFDSQDPFAPQQQYGQYQQSENQYPQGAGQYPQGVVPQYIDPYADPQAQQYNTAPNNGGKKSKRVIAGVIAAIVLLAGAGGALGYFLLKDKKDDDSSLKGENGVMEADSSDKTTAEKSTRSRTTTKTTTTKTTTAKKTTEAATTQTTTEKPTEPPVNTKGIDPSVGTGGDDFTVIAWDAQDAPALLEVWEEMGGDASRLSFHNLDCFSSDAADRYNELLLKGVDMDIYFCESDWADRYINDDSKTLPLSKLGFTDDDFEYIYKYTDIVGMDTNGERKGVSWQACPGGFAYRADLAEQYLGVKSPEEMQARIGTWDSFVNAAWTIAGSTGGKVALADSVGGMWHAYSSGTKYTQSMADTFTKYVNDLWSCGGVAHCEQWGDDWVPKGQDGSIMGYFVSTWGLSGFLYDASSNSYGKWAVCQGPSSYFWGGTWMVVNPATDNGEEARDLIAGMTTNMDMMATYAIRKPDFVNNRVVMNMLIEEDFQEYFNADVMENFGGQNVFAVLAESAKSAGYINSTDDKDKKAEYYNGLLSSLK